jgi:hypothetical protein
MKKCVLYAMEIITCNGIREDMDTLYAELATRRTQIPDNINHIENFMVIVGQKAKNHQSWADINLKIMLNTIWHIIS